MRDARDPAKAKGGSDDAPRRSRACAGPRRRAARRQGATGGEVEGRNLTIEWRFADGKADRLPELAADLMRLKVDLIVAVSPEPVQAARTATTSIPIVMVAVADPVTYGFVASLSRPGGNVTGMAFLLPEISTKRLELLREVVPDLSRVAGCGTRPTDSGRST